MHPPASVHGCVTAVTVTAILLTSTRPTPPAHPHLSRRAFCAVIRPQVNGDALLALSVGTQPFYHTSQSQPDDSVVTKVPDSLSEAKFLPSDLHDSLMPATDPLVLGTVQDAYYARCDRVHDGSNLHPCHIQKVSNQACMQG